MRARRDVDRFGRLDVIVGALGRPGHRFDAQRGEDGDVGAGELGGLSGVLLHGLVVLIDGDDKRRLGQVELRLDPGLLGELGGDGLSGRSERRRLRAELVLRVSGRLPRQVTLAHAELFVGALLEVELGAQMDRGGMLLRRHDVDPLLP